jgi:hypothetical protein
MYNSKYKLLLLVSVAAIGFSGTARALVDDTVTVEKKSSEESSTTITAQPMTADNKPVGHASMFHVSNKHPKAKREVKQGKKDEQKIAYYTWTVETPGKPSRTLSVLPDVYRNGGTVDLGDGLTAQIVPVVPGTSTAGGGQPTGGTYTPWTPGPSIPGAWSGVFVGGHLIGTSTDVRTNEYVAATGMLSTRLNDNGSTAGIGIDGGANFQSGNFVYGVTGDASWVHNQIRHDFAGGSYIGVTFDSIGTAEVRAGYLVMPNMLLYVQGGGAYASGLFQIDFGGPETNERKTIFGGVIGGGIEGLLPSSLFGANTTSSVFLDYNHYFWDCVELRMPAASPGFNYRWEPQSDVVKLGYRVRWGNWGN